MTFPVLVCIPMGGTKVPSELRQRIKIKSKVYLLTVMPTQNKSITLVQIQMKIISVPYVPILIDVNRKENDLPPEQHH